MQNFYRKKYMDRILETIQKEKLILLVGARQVGKTTIMDMTREALKEQWKKCLYFNFEDFFGKTFESKTEIVDFFQFEYGFDLHLPGVLFLDEIQYLSNPEWVLKSLYDDKTLQTKIIATGSRFWWQKKVGSSLIGRGEIMKIYPFDFFEFLEYREKDIGIFSDFTTWSESKFRLIERFLEEYLEFGGYPAVVRARTREGKVSEMKKIIERFFEKDFSYFMKTADIIDFKRVFQFIAVSIKNTIKIDNIATNLGMSRYKVQQFLTFLEDSYLIYEVYPYFTDKSREYNQNPEIYFNDLWVLRHIAWMWQNIGNINENFVFLELLKSEYIENIFFYKKNTGSEIDFIAETKENKLIPIEVKSANKDIIPKIFFQFYEDYKKDIDRFFVTTKSEYMVRELYESEIIFIPTFLLSRILKRE